MAIPKTNPKKTTRQLITKEGNKVMGRALLKIDKTSSIPEIRLIIIYRPMMVKTKKRMKTVNKLEKELKQLLKRNKWEEPTYTKKRTNLRRFKW